MSLQRMDVLLKSARANHIALGAFECWDSLNIQGIAIAAERCHAPVIFQATSMEYGPIGGPEALAVMVKFYVDHYHIDAALHLDHGASLHEVDECLAAGFTSVMLDASSRPFEENVKLCAEAASMAHKCNASCEAELGHVGGGDGGEGSQGVLTVPAEAVEYVDRTKVDCLAVAIGTVHGEYRGEPKLHLDLLKEISEKVSLPLVLHGGSGTPADQLRPAIRLGISKINICTDINKAFLSGIAEANAHLTPSLAGNFYHPAVNALSAKAESFIRMFRGED